jgi:hypothetical protein
MHLLGELLAGEAFFFRCYGTAGTRRRLPMVRRPDRQRFRVVDEKGSWAKASGPFFLWRFDRLPERFLRASAGGG